MIELGRFPDEVLPPPPPPPPPFALLWDIMESFRSIIGGEPGPSSLPTPPPALPAPNASVSARANISHILLS
jgi:hypothetical protein